MTRKTTKRNPMKDASDFVAFPLRGDMASRILANERRRIIVYLEDHGPWSTGSRNGEWARVRA